MRRMRQIGVTGVRVLERHHKAMGKSIGQPFWTDVGSPFERGNAVDLCGQRLKASNDFLNLLLGHLRLDFEEDDMPQRRGRCVVPGRDRTMAAEKHRCEGNANWM